MPNILEIELIEIPDIVWTRLKKLIKSFFVRLACPHLNTTFTGQRRTIYLSAKTKEEKTLEVIWYSKCDHCSQVLKTKLKL